MIRRRWQPADGAVVIGIGGGSGSGKSTIAGLLAEGLLPLSTEVIALDRFFKDPSVMPTYRSEVHGEHRPDFNHPDSVDRAAMLAVCRGPVSTDVVILDGILALHDEELLAAMHLRLYVTIDLAEMLARRTSRNLAAGYGGDAAEIAAYNRECVVPQHRRYNAPTAAVADLLIPNDAGTTDDRDRLVAEICAAIHWLPR